MLRAVLAFIFITLSFSTPASAEFLQDGSYRTSAGFIIDASCFSSLTEDEKVFGSINFENIAETVIAKTQACAQSQLLAGLEAKVFRIIQSHPRVTCILKGCPNNNATACAEVAKNSINLNDVYAFKNPATWFHEVLHLAEFDNQSPAVHNSHTDAADARDTVIFWERTCFKPEAIKELAARGIEACSYALNYWPLRTSPMQSTITEVGRSLCPAYQQKIERYQTVLESSLFENAKILSETERSIGFMRKIFRERLTFDFSLPHPMNLERWKANHCNHEDDHYDLQKCLIRFKDDVFKFLSDTEVTPGYCISKKEKTEISDYLYSILTKF